MKFLVAAANAIVPTVRAGTVHLGEDGRLSMRYWRDGGFGAYRLDVDELPQALRPPLRETCQASWEELTSNPDGPFEVLIAMTGIRRMVLVPMPGARQPTLFWVGTSQSEPLAPSELAALDVIAGRAAGVLAERDPQEELGRLRRIAIAGELVPALFEELDVRDVFDSVSEIAGKVIAHDALGLGIFNEEMREVTFYVRNGKEPWASPKVLTQTRPPQLLKLWDFQVHDDVSTNPLEPDDEMARLGFRTSLRLPIRFHDTLIGSVEFAAREPAKYTESDVDVARRIADQLALALSHRHRLSEGHRRAATLQERAAGLEMLDGLLGTLSNSLDIRDVFDRISEIARKVLPHDAMSIPLLAEDRQHLTIHAAHGFAVALPPLLPVPDWPFLQEDWTFHIVNDLPADPFFSKLPGVQSGMQSLLVSPIRRHGQLEGAVNFYSRSKDRFTRDDVPIGRRIADHVALALSHQKLAEERGRSAALRERAANLDMLDGLLTALTGVLDIREVFDRVSEVAKKVLPHEAVSIAELINSDWVKMYAGSGLGDLPMPFETPVPNRRLLSDPRDFILIEDLSMRPDFAAGPGARAGMRSLLVVPIHVQGRQWGSLGFYGREPQRFDRDDVLVARRIADHVALAISHQRLADEIRQIEELKSRAANLEMLDGLLESLGEAGELQEIFPRVSAIAKKVIGYDAMTLPVLLPGGLRARIHASVTPETASFPEIVDVPENLRSNPNWDYDLVDDMREHPAQKDLVATSLGYRSALRVPVRFRGEFAAAVSFFSFTPGFFKPADVLVARRVADRIALNLARERGAAASKRADEATARASRLESRVRALTEELDARTGYRRVVGESKSWRQVLTQATQVAPTETTALLLGESGTGKEVVARFIHRASSRKDGPFVALNCAALPEQLLEAELFGYERGAFTGATQSKPGQLEQAAGGTLFLDEVAEMAPSAQAKFLRVLQEREFQRLGGTRILHTDARVIAATNRDLHQAMAQGQFREDLFYRLNVFSLNLPPLRERREDVLALSQAFLIEIGRGLGRPPSGISREARDRLVAYHWPGNVRELRNILERAAILCEGGPILSEHLSLGPLVAPPASVAGIESDDPAPRAGVRSTMPQAQPPSGDLKSMERSMIQKALQDARFNKSRAAQFLGLTRSQLYGRMRRYGLE